MAKELIYKVDTRQAVQSIADLRTNIAELKKRLDDSSLSWEEQQKYVRELADNQAALRNAMHGTAASFGEVTKAATASNVAFDNNNKLVQQETYSYNELVRKLALLKEEWRSTDNAAKRIQIGEQINSVNNRLKAMDASVGVYSRNVGSYANVVSHLGDALTQVGRFAPGVTKGIGGITMGLKTMSATPAVAILGILASVFQKVMDAMNGAEDSAQGLSKALAPFKALGDMLTRSLQAVADVVVGLVGWFGKLTTAVLGNNKATEERLALAEKEAHLAKEQRETLVANAEAERDIAELRAKASEKLNYTASERLAFLEQAGKLEADISMRAYEDAKKQYEIIKAKNALSKSSTEALDAEAQAYANMVKAETAYYTQIRTINTGITKARREEMKDARDAAKAVKDAATAKINAEKEYYQQLLQVVEDGSKTQQKVQNSIARAEYEKAVAEAKQKIQNEADLNRTLELLQLAFQQKVAKNQQTFDEKQREQRLLEISNIMNGYEQGSQEYLSLQVQLRQEEYDTLFKLQGENDQQFLARKIEAFKALQAANEQYQDAEIAATRKGLENEMNALAAGSIEAYEKAVEIAKYDIDNLHQKIGESNEDFLARQLAAQKAYREAVAQLDDAEMEQGALQIEQRMALLQEGSDAYLSLAVELKQYELDTLHQLEGESNDAFRLRELQAQKAHEDAIRSLWQARLNVMNQAAGAISGIMGSIADALESNTDMTEAEAKKAKNLRIASATIDMLQGAVTAYSGAQSLGVPMGPIIGAINAAAVVAAGIANIAKIKATQVSKDAGGGASSTPVVPAAVSAPTAEPQVTQVRNITGASEEERLDKMASDQRVYILDSDLQAADSQRRVQVAETTF